MFKAARARVLTALVGAAFRTEALAYFANEVPDGDVQRIDGVLCFSPMGNRRFTRLRLRMMAAAGLIEKRHIPGAVWRSTRNLPYYGLPRRKPLSPSAERRMLALNIGAGDGP